MSLTYRFHDLILPYKNSTKPTLLHIIQLIQITEIIGILNCEMGYAPSCICFILLEFFEVISQIMKGQKSYSGSIFVR